MALQPASGTASCVATASGGLLPRLFTLASWGTRSGCFLLPFKLYPHEYLPVRQYGALCCPDFPLWVQSDGSSRQAFLSTKLVIFLRIPHFL